MGKIYTFAFYSSIGTNVGGGAATTREAYYVDWGRIPDKKYKVSFTFSSSNVTQEFDPALNTNKMPMVFIDLGQDSIVCSGANTTANYRAGFLGYLRTTGIAQITTLFASTVDNPPVSLQSRPFNNNVEIHIHNNGADPDDYYATTGNTGPVNYTLILSLEEQD